MVYFLHSGLSESLRVNVRGKCLLRLARNFLSAGVLSAATTEGNHHQKSLSRPKRNGVPYEAGNFSQYEINRNCIKPIFQRILKLSLN